jgi:hypothetical protein
MSKPVGIANARADNLQDVLQRVVEVVNGLQGTRQSGERALRVQDLLDAGVLTTEPQGGLVYAPPTAGSGGFGTVTSVNLGASTGLTPSGGPVTGTGTLTYTLSANLLGWNGLATSAKQDALGYVPVNRAGDTMTGLLHLTRAGAETETVRVSNTTDSKRLHLAAGTAGAQVRSENSDLLLNAADSGAVVRLNTQGTTRVSVSNAKVESSVELEISKNVPAISSSASNDGHLELLTGDNSSPRIGFHKVGVEALALYYSGGNSLRVINNSGVDSLLWNSNNDGGGSGLDADLLHGVPGNYFVQGTGPNRTTNVENLNTAMPSGFFESTPSGSNGPAGATWHWYLNLRHSTTGNHYAGQIANPIGSDDFWTRHINNGTPGTWRRLAKANVDETFRDITATRGDGTGVIYLGGGTRYLYYDGTKYDLPGAPLTVGGSVSDPLGNVRDIPVVTRNSTTAFVSTDRGQGIAKDNTTAYTWTVNTGVFSAGMTILVVNDGSAGDVTIAQGSGMTLISGTTTGNFTLTPGQSRTLWALSATRVRVL